MFQYEKENIAYESIDPLAFVFGQIIIVEIKKLHIFEHEIWMKRDKGHIGAMCLRILYLTLITFSTEK